VKAAALAAVLLADSVVEATESVHVLKVNGETGSFNSSQGGVTVTTPATVEGEDTFTLQIDDLGTWFLGSGAEYDIDVNYAGYDENGNLFHDYGTQFIQITAPQTIGPNPSCGDITCGSPTTFQGSPVCNTTSCAKATLCTWAGSTYCMYYASTCRVHLDYNNTASCQCSIPDHPECPQHDPDADPMELIYPICRGYSFECRVSVGFAYITGN